MSMIVVELDSVTASRLAEFAALHGNSVQDAIGKAVNFFLDNELSDEGKFHSVGEPNQASLEAIAEANDPNHIQESYSVDEYLERMKQVTLGVEREILGVQ
ncbi:MAG: hypothetical protein QM537_03410 [Candidatus Symbiobacter sp.]|nr:hypothetical protein [Candidatus Symbiobacter sp.]